MQTRSWRCFGAASLSWLCAVGAWAQADTPYQRSQKQQELYDLQQQNARQQQQIQQQQRDQDWQQAVQQSQAQQNAAAAQGRQVLQTWQSRPALAADRNPLLGRWNSMGNQAQGKAPAGGDIAALANALIGGLTGGLCDSMLGRGLVEFRPTSVVAIGPGGREQLLYHAEYRGGDSRVVVLPRDAASFTHMIIDFNGPDRAMVVGPGCVLSRGSANSGAAEPRTSAAAKWDRLGTWDSNGPVDMYADRGTIRKAGNVAQMWDLMDFKSPRTLAGVRFLSVRNQYAYDCANVRRRMIATRGFSDHMGRGNVVASEDNVLAWESIPGDSPFMTHWKAACAKS
jgi:Surface-adhesin protein E